MISTDLMDRIPANKNPYNYDLYHEGLLIGTNIVIMYRCGNKDECHYIIACDKRTGERVRLTFSDGEKVAEKGEILARLVTLGFNRMDFVVQE
jgi:hypothetical protein